MPQILGYIFPLLPLIRSLKDQDRRFYVFLEQPLIGIVVTFASLYIAEVITNGSFVYNTNFWRDFFEVYMAYQLANIIRDGVNTDSHIKLRSKVLLNWYYSVISYVLFTAADRIAKAKNTEELVFAYSIVLFSIIWPVFSQAISTYLWTPILFSKFPKRSLLIRLSDISISQTELLKDEKDLWNIRWIKWYRNSKNLKIKIVKYWFIKTLVGLVIGIAMTTIYFWLRWSLVGKNPDSPSIFVEMLKSYIVSKW